MNYIKGGLKTLTGYFISLLVFIVFLYVFISITKNRFSYWLPVYSFLLFLLLFSVVYSDYKRLAMKEKKPQYELNPYPLKGLVYGLIGFSPIILIELVYPLVALSDPTAVKIKELALSTLLGPVYFIIRAGGKSFISYAIASLTVPVIAMLGYLAGFYGFELGKYLKIGKKVQQTNTVPEFKKSPWNPSVQHKPKQGKKKKQ